MSYLTLFQHVFVLSFFAHSYLNCHTKSIWISRQIYLLLLYYRQLNVNPSKQIFSYCCCTKGSLSLSLLRFLRSVFFQQLTKEFHQNFVESHALLLTRGWGHSFANLLYKDSLRTFQDGISFDTSVSTKYLVI